MSHENIICAWKDTDFRNSLSAKERALLPEHPAGIVEFTSMELGNVAGGAPTPTLHLGYTHRTTCG